MGYRSYGRDKKSGLRRGRCVPYEVARREVHHRYGTSQFRLLHRCGDSFNFHQPCCNFLCTSFMFSAESSNNTTVQVVPHRDHCHFYCLGSQIPDRCAAREQISRNHPTTVNLGLDWTSPLPLFFVRNGCQLVITMNTFIQIQNISHPSLFEQSH